MAAPIYPKSADEILTTLAELFEYQQNHEMAAVLRSAHAYIEHAYSDDQYEGVEYFRLRLELPVKEFAPLEPTLEKAERVIKDKLQRTFGNIGGNILRGASIVAMPSVPRTVGAHKIAKRYDGSTIWEDGTFRLFLSHVSTYKSETKKLKEQLRPCGVSAFVAHEDIEPSLDWQNEIVGALESMDAMVALLTPDFHLSNWTDQEVGIALGRQVLVIPVQLGTLPYGFIGKQQALRGTFDDIAATASGIVDILGKHATIGARMREALVRAFEQAKSYAASRTASLKIVTLKGFTPEQLDRIAAGCENNRQVKESTGVVWRINKYLSTVVPAKPPIANSENDDIPF